jgi:cobalt-zinc-cadmium efflux system outer membrane protein
MKRSRSIARAGFSACALVLILLGLPGPEAMAQSVEEVAGAPPGGRHAAPVPEANLSFAKAWRKVNDASPDLRARDSIDASWRHRARQAGTSPNPYVALSVEDIGARDELFGQTQWTFSVSQPIPLGSRLTAARRVEERGRAAWEHEAAYRLLQLKARLKEYFVRVLAAQQRIRGLRSSIARYEEVQEVIEGRVEAGAVPRVRLRRVSQALALESEYIAEAEREVTRSLAEVPSLWGGRAGEVATLEGVLAKPLPGSETPFRLDDLQGNPSIRGCAASADHWSAEAELREEQAVPDASVAAGYRGLDGFGSHAAVVEFSVPLPVFDRNRGAIDEARAMKRAQDFACSGVLSRLETEAASLHAQALALRDQFVRTRDELVPSAQTAFAAAYEALVRGEMDLNDILDLAAHLAAMESRATSLLQDYWLVVLDYETLTNSDLLSFEEVTR